MNVSKILKNPWFIFSPFLLLFAVLVFVYPTDGTLGDESSYLNLAQNLLNGFFSPDEPNIDLPSGPGYAILLMPFIAFHLPLLIITLINALLFYISIVLLFKSLYEIVSFRQALLFSLIWATYLNSYEYIPLIYTETFAVFLVSILIYFLVKVFNSDSSSYIKKYILMSGVTFGFLVLTKVIFSFVLVFMLFGIGILMLSNRKNTNYLRGISILLIALCTTLPYLIYTYQLTGKVFYWSTSGGNNLYWMSTPYKGEYGNYYALENPQLNLDAAALNSLMSNHQKDFEGTKDLNSVEKDDAFKKMALNNIKSHPAKYVENIISNIGRIIFNQPFSYKLQSTRNLSRLPHNGIIIVLLIFSIFPTVKNWRSVPFLIQFLLFFIFLYLGLSLFGSAETRMFSVVVPALLMWIAFIINKSLKVSFKFN